MAKEKHTYTVELYGNGLAIRMGKVPKRIWRYVETECGGDADTYRGKWDNGLPEDMQLWKGDSSCDALDQAIWGDRKFRDSCLVKLDACIPDSSGITGITVSDEDGDLVYETKILDDAYGDVSFSKGGRKPKIESEEVLPPDRRRDNFLFLFTMLYRGTWAKCKFEADKFDPSKLTIGLSTLLCNHYGDGVTYVESIGYDGDSISLLDNEWQAVDWKDDGFLEFYDAAPPDDRVMAKLSGDQWAGLLARQPQFADKCDWSKLSGMDWTNLLKRQPQFADKCEWPRLNDYDWRSLLKMQPQFKDLRGE